MEEPSRISGSLFGTQTPPPAPPPPPEAEPPAPHSLRRRLLIILPAVIVLLALVAGVVVLYERKQTKEIEKAREEQKLAAEFVTENINGNPDAKIVLHVTGFMEDDLPPALLSLLREAVGTKPSEICFKGSYAEKFNQNRTLTLNGESKVQHNGAVCELSQDMPLATLAEIINEAHARFYPGAQYPLKLTVDTPPPPPPPKPAEKSAPDTPPPPKPVRDDAIKLHPLKPLKIPAAP